MLVKARNRQDRGEVVADINFQPMEFFKLWFDDALNNNNIAEISNEITTGTFTVLQ